MPRRTAQPVPAGADAPSAEALVVQVRTLLAEAQALSTRLAALNEVAAVMQSRLDADSVLQALARHARWLIDFQVCSVALREEEGYRVRLLRGGPPSSQRHPAGAGAIGRAIAGRHAILLTKPNPEDLSPPEMESGLIVPLISGGELLGTLNFYARAPGRYTQDDMRIAAALATQVAALLENVRLFADVTRARDDLSTVLESIGDAVLVIDRRGRIRLLNGAARALLSIGGGALEGRRALWLLRQTQANGQPLVTPAAVRLIVVAWRAQGSGGGGMLQLTDGRSLEWTLAPLAATGELAGTVLTLRDVSPRLALERLRDDMIQMLVHDLRTPLTSLIMGLDMLGYAETVEDAELRAHVLSTSRASAGRLLAQINLILDVRKFEAGRIELDRTPTNIAWLCEQAVRPLLPIAAQSHQQVCFALPSDLPAADIDRGMIERVLENLVGNALKFTPQAGTIEVGARLASAGRAIELWVRDNGIGVPPELRDTIFEKYGQAPGDARRKGTGLGLTFCKLTVEAHGGRIGVDPVPTGGSRFWLQLPLDAPAA
jgi:two-component system, NtrC family, sensor histidine kinase KinB